MISFYAILEVIPFNLTMCLLHFAFEIIVPRCIRGGFLICIRILVDVQSLTHSQLIGRCVGECSIHPFVSYILKRSKAFMWLHFICRFLEGQEI
jgi:hypothetical protein